MRAKIRLAYFVNSMHVGGTELNALRTIERLDRTVFDLAVFHLGIEGPLLETYHALGVPMHLVHLNGFLRPAIVGEGFRLARLFRSEAIDIVHSHDIYANLMAVPWARLAGVPVVVASKRWTTAVPSRAHVLANRIAYRLATAVLANSRAVADTLVATDRVPMDRIKCLPNFVEDHAFAPYSAGLREALLLSHGVPHDALIVGIVASLQPVKDHMTLLKAVVLLKDVLPAMHVLVIGDGVERERLMRAGERMGVSSRIHFVGILPNRPNPHALLHVSVLCSTSEGSPNSILEAMAAGCGIVSTYVGGIPEMISHGATGLLVPPGDPTALADALHTVGADPGLRAALGRSARERAATVFSESRVIGELSGWYRSLYDARAARSRQR